MESHIKNLAWFLTMCLISATNCTYRDTTSNTIQKLLHTLQPAWEVVSDEVQAILSATPKRGSSLLEFSPHASQGNYSKSEVGDPLFLTPLLEANKVSQARKQAKVGEISAIPSYTGFMTVNKNFNSNMFFWYVPAAFNAETAPLVVWLQGGPGGSSLFGFFVEHGPFYVDKEINLRLRPTSWALTYNMLYIDQPVGTGFSFTESEEGYAKNQEDVARDLYDFMQQFYKMFPELLQNELYITGESYAGKYVPAISYKIHQENKKGNQPKLPLTGLAIGDGLCDPENQLAYGEFIFQIGLVDEKDRDIMKDISKVIKGYIRAKDWPKAARAYDNVIDYFENKTQLSFYYNYLLSDQPDTFTYYTQWLEKPSVRKDIHVGKLKYSDISMTVHQYLYEDMPKTIKPWLETLLDANYKVMIYNGQLDVIIAYPATEHFIADLNWQGKSQYKEASRLVWKVGGDVAGYAREVGNFRQVMVRDSGHILPYDQPKWAFDMMHRFIQGKSFGDKA
ncbi:hypothetical protein TCAL_02456 [Tigriopus californicus]|uniref:Carboxypeptidase n=2 Tax=Tigriopus californicus TaxID=6832 RepID=A0A553NXZ1_TIGCA|nr:probable serine carboxypeptidase CPVL isoform X2 [Tigriopus californicus]XP_059090349.1 probable serine carboxypeptidase CPVL isoform X2 [Tigriopus californicus]TRY70301.1 hypothetical protein TCAL_02456 [Tigriopus californicus]|eukprot:TCALIF_02456-PA protein Name:"Similar to CPVL Probable serine carboxypeptidase CPVL (Homo sapiens)" AED:0.07 eAED:0.07 QI:202/1/1/1/0.8/0.83/6/79/506